LAYFIGGSHRAGSTRSHQRPPVIVKVATIAKERTTSKETEMMKGTLCIKTRNSREKGIVSALRCFVVVAADAVH